MASLLARLLTAMRPAPALLVRGADGPDLYAGMVGSGYPTAPPIDQASAMQAMARSPWVWACVEGIVGDLCGLPWYVERPVDGGKRWEPVDHPELTRLMERPAPSGRADALAMRRQWVADYITTRTSYLWLDQPRAPKILRRLHPSHAEPVVDAMGLPTSWEIGRTTVERGVVPERIIQARGICWSPNVDGEVYATSPIEAIAKLLATEIATMDGMRRQSRLMRPDAVLTAPDGEEWSPKQAKDIATWLHEWLTSRGGTLIMPYGGSKLTPLGHSPREMDYIAGLARITSAILAVFRVPPTRVGIQAANYATAQQEAILYWEARIAEAAVLDDAMTRLARRWAGFETVRVRTDFSGVNALQEGRSQRLARVGQHILNGMDPAKAYEVEGLEYEAGAVGTETAPQADAEEPRSLNAERHIRAALEALDHVGEQGLTPDRARAIATTIRAAQAAARRSAA